MKREAGSSQAAWALLTEGVAASRIEAHRLRGQMSRVIQLVNESEHRAHLYEVAGDLISSMPQRVETLERHLDRTSYALSVLGEQTLRDQLPLSDRKVVDEAVERAKPLFGPGLKKSLDRVVEAYLRTADLNPPLGVPGGPCQVIRRVEDTVRQPLTREQLIAEIEQGDDLKNDKAVRIYHPLVENGPPNSPFKQIGLTAHAQYRMDLRKIDVPTLRAALNGFLQYYLKLKSQGPMYVRPIEEDIARSKVIEWADKKTGVFVAFRIENKSFVVITTYWTNKPNPRPPGDGGCDMT